MQKNLLPQHWRLLFYHMRYGFKPLCIGDLTPISFPSKTHVKNIILPTSWTFSIKWQQFFKLVIMVKQLKFQIHFWFWFWFSNSCNIFQFMDFKRGTLLLWNWCAGTTIRTDSLVFSKCLIHAAICIFFYWKKSFRDNQLLSSYLVKVMAYFDNI